jgi:phosphoribosylformylglycinamidine synthase I
MRFGVVVFPGTWSDTDCFHALADSLGQDVRYVWHKERDLSGLDCVILPGGFSYGDYLRPGAIAKLSPVMDEVRAFADRGGLVMGICNGFQVLCESGLLPGALLRNEHLQFRCQWVNLRVDNASTPFTNECAPRQLLSVPISHGDGNYFADEATITRLEERGQVAFRYVDAAGDATREANPNGSLNSIAGITNEEGNVLGMMPHPERCVEKLVGGTDGLAIFRSLLNKAGAVTASPWA